MACGSLVMQNWPIEYIPDQASLFYRVPVSHLRPDRKPAPGNFRESGGSISTDWENYSTAAETRARPGRPERFAVIRLSVGGVREIEELTVSHSPVQPTGDSAGNRAHTDVLGLEENDVASPELGRKERIRTELHRRFHIWEIAPGTPVDPVPMAKSRAGE
jgi:hypothetical protein